jgi:sugar/nucleoside kinase (ribokinase family)
MVDLVGVGLNATDTLIPLADYPARGSKVEFRGATVMPGGQTATTVVACQSWGMSTRYVGKLGDDDAARLHREAFVRAGVEARLIEVSEAASPQSLIIVDGGGERTVLCRKDERLILQPEDLERAWIENARALHVDGYDTAAATLAAGWARAAGIPVIADLDEMYPGVERLIESVDYLIVSRDFPSRLMKEKDLKKSVAGDAIALRLRTDGRDTGRGRCAGLEWRPASAPFRLPCAGRGYHRRRRRLPCRIHLWAAPRLATRAPARLCLCRRCAELYGKRGQGRHSPCHRN